MKNKELTPVEPMLSEEQMKIFSDMINSSEYQNYTANKMQEQIRENLGLNKLISPPKNKMIEEQQKLNSNVEHLKSQLASIQYENMKLNAQIEVMNKTIDSNNEKLDELRTANTNLKTVNRTLIESNKHYWRNTFIISFVVALVFFLLGLAFPT